MALYYIDLLVGMSVIAALDYFFAYKRERSTVVNGTKRRVREMAQDLLKSPVSYSYDGSTLFIPLPVAIAALLAWQDLGYQNGEHVFAIVFLATLLTIIAVGRRVTLIASSWMLYTSTTFTFLSFSIISSLLYLLLTAFAIGVASFFVSFVLHRKNQEPLKARAES